MTSLEAPGAIPTADGAIEAQPMPIPVIDVPAEAAYSVVPYRGRRSLRDLAAAGKPEQPATAPLGSGTTEVQRGRALPTVLSGEIRTRNVAIVPSIVRVDADKRVLRRMTVVQREAFFRDREAARIGAVREVKCGGGWCDLLSSSEVVEVKAGRFWRHALGQVLAYATYWPERRRRIHLFDVERAQVEEAARICAVYGVEVSVALVGTTRRVLT